MQKMKVSNLERSALDWAVAKSEGMKLDGVKVGRGRYTFHISEYSPSTNWSQGGPIIEREGIGVAQNETNDWIASYGNLYGHSVHGDTPLIAAMRCYVASRLGDEVEVPDELVAFVR